MTRTRRPVALAIVFLLFLATAAGADPVRPRLTVLISIDQFRADYLTRFSDLYKPASDESGIGGFRYLMEQGAYYTDAHHDHYPLYTGPGHSIHFTGAPPYKTGIVGNDWFDRDLNRERDWVQAIVEANVYLNRKAFEDKGIDFAQAEAAAAEILRKEPGIYAAYTRSQILDGRVPDTDVGRRVARSSHPKVSGDVVLVSDPYWVPGQLTGTTHGTPYAYDTSVPLLLAGAGIRPGRYTQRVSTLDIVPTLSDLLGILQPSGCEGHVLSQALK